MTNNEPLVLKILRLIKEEGPLSPQKVREKLGVQSRSTVPPLISMLRTLGLVTYYVDTRGEKWQGVYVVTDYGKQCPALTDFDFVGHLRHHIPEGVKELLHVCGCREYEKDGVWYLDQCPAHKMETDSLIESLGKETTKE